MSVTPVGLRLALSRSCSTCLSRNQARLTKLLLNSNFIRLLHCQRTVGKVEMAGRNENPTRRDKKSSPIRVVCNAERIRQSLVSLPLGDLIETPQSNLASAGIEKPDPKITWVQLKSC